MAGRERDDSGFLSRWSERKREAKQTQEEAQSDLIEQAAVPSGSPADAAAESAAAESEAFDPAELPDIETLDKDSDFSVFMHSKVPEALRRRALRRLWRVDPTFAFLDGMNDYDEDYTDAAMVVEGLKTAYQVGKGMVRPDEAEEDAPQNEQAQAGEALKEDEDSAALSSAEENESGNPEDPPEGEEDPQQMAEGASASDTHAEAQSAPRALEEAESSPGAAAAKPASRPAGSALRRRWGDQFG